MKKIKVVHWLVEECFECGYQEFACGVENPHNYSYFSDDVTCRKCLPSNKSRNQNDLQQITETSLDVSQLLEDLQKAYDTIDNMDAEEGLEILKNVITELSIKAQKTKG